MSDRIAVMYKGDFVGILDAEGATVEAVGFLMGGGGLSNFGCVG